jgi:hypothetical protein
VIDPAAAILEAKELGRELGVLDVLATVRKEIESHMRLQRIAIEHGAMERARQHDCAIDALKNVLDAHAVKQ